MAAAQGWELPELPQEGRDRQKRNAEVMVRAADRTGQSMTQAMEEPGMGRKLWRVLVDFIPVGSSVQKYLQAREEFNHYPPDDMSPEAEKLRQAARERFLMSVIELAIDALSLGGTAGIPDEVITWLHRYRLLLRMQKGNDGDWENLSGYQKLLVAIDVPGHIIKILLAFPGVKEAVDGRLKQ